MITFLAGNNISRVRSLSKAYHLMLYNSPIRYLLHSRIRLLLLLAWVCSTRTSISYDFDYLE